MNSVCRKFSLYTIVVLFVLSIATSSVFFQQRNQFELHFEPRGKEKTLNKEALKDFTAQMQLQLGKDETWQIDIKEDDITLTYGSAYDDSINSEASLWLVNNVNANTIKEHMQDVVCAIDTDGKDVCCLEFDVRELDKDVMYSDGRGNDKVIASTTVKAKDPSHSIKVTVFNPGEKDESIATAFRSGNGGTFYSEESSIYSTRSTHPFLNLITELPTLDSAAYELVDNVTGIYKANGDEIVPFLPEDTFHETISALLVTENRLIVSRQIKDGQSYLESYDFDGNCIEQIPLTYENINTMYVQDDKILVDVMHADLNHTIYIYQYMDEKFQVIDEFNKLPSEIWQPLYKNNRLYEVDDKGSSVYLNIYEQERCIFQGSIVGTLFESNNKFKQLEQPYNMNSRSSVWDRLMKSDHEFWLHVNSFE